MQPVDTGVAISWSHDGGEYLISTGQFLRPGVGDGNVLLLNGSRLYLLVGLFL